MEWISVEDRLPDGESPLSYDESVSVIANWDNGDIEQTRYHYIEMDHPSFQRICGTDEGNEGWDGNVGYVTHWMPLPPPPKS